MSETITITIEEAQAKLKDLIHRLAPDEEVVITENERPVAKLKSEQPKAAHALRPGLYNLPADHPAHGEFGDHNRLLIFYQLNS